MKKFIQTIKAFFTKPNSMGSKTNTPNYLQVGQKFVGKLKNEYQDHILIITDIMLDDDESTLLFLHYYGFEQIKTQ